jgi:hypothetical protein
MKSFELRPYRKYLVGFFAMATLLAVANILHFHRQVNCADCFARYGLPFTLYHLGGFGGGAAIVWKGVLADCVTLIFGSALIGWVWTLSARQPSN